jgi:hypothetical protein
MTQPQLMPLTGLTPFGQPPLTGIGGAGGLGDLGGIVNQLVHNPAVSGIIGSISQANPQIGGVIQSALGALQNGNIAGMIPQLASTIGQLTGHPEIGSLATQFLGALGPQLGQPTLGGFPQPGVGFPPAGFAQPGLGVQPGLGIQPGLSPLTSPLGHF